MPITHYPLHNSHSQRIISKPKDIVVRKTSEDSTNSTASEFDEANMIVGEGIIWLFTELKLEFNPITVERRASGEASESMPINALFP